MAQIYRMIGGQTLKKGTTNLWMKISETMQNTNLGV
eukprot:CAMPEP_0182904406 /NCGR_PEP_ID=MMETSP0034_2-20130328/32094_1 /TAXON_ID=156128 /ORGANISM="Nephroselmis pyriformis, Strain CCMP717" /LENGTH=35 /DNA_ID= /DNA_START= /DNA_END= /DNA_ORIENTATION=